MVAPMSIAQLFTPEVSLRVLQVMLHFLWQGCALGIAAAIIVRYWRQGASSARYWLLLALLLAMPLCAIVTFFAMGDRSVPIAKNQATQAPLAAPEPHRPVVAPDNSGAG